MGNRLQGHYHGYTEARKNLPEKTPLGKKKCDRKSGWEPQPKLRAVSSSSYEASQLSKISIQTKIDLASAKGAMWVLKPRWTSRVLLPVIYHCIITRDARARGPCRVVSLAGKIFISALFANPIVINTSFLIKYNLALYRSQEKDDDRHTAKIRGMSAAVLEEPRSAAFCAFHCLN